MDLFVQYLLFGVGQQADGTQGGGGSWISFLMFPAIIAIFYFLIIRPQNKKQKETQKMLENLKKGDRVVTIGGIHGVIQSVKEQSVIVKIDDNVKVEFSRSAISTIEAAAREDKREDKSDSKDAETPEIEEEKK